MKPLTTITNQISTCAVQVGKSTGKSAAYAAECTKHKLIYIGQIGDQVKNRFNRHRSDIRCYLNLCELSKHFCNNVCNFEKDLKISILEKVKSTEAKRQYKTDQWIVRLDISYAISLCSSIRFWLSILTIV